jgi:hypothetical protein
MIFTVLSTLGAGVGVGVSSFLQAEITIAASKIIGSFFILFKHFEVLKVR